MRRKFPQLVGAAFLLTFANLSSAQVSEIRGAQITLESKTISVELVTLENRRDSYLVAWHIGLIKDGRVSGIYTSDYSRHETAASSAGAIAPKQQRVIEVLSDADIDSTTLRLAVFEDGHIEGVPEAIEQWEKQRRERADDAQFWIRAFEGIPAGTDHDVRRYLELRAAERAARAAGDPSGIRSRVSQALGQSWRSSSLIDFIPGLSMEASRQYNALTRRPARAPTLETAAPVAMSSRRDSRAQLVAVIRNLRDVPIEAVGFELVEPMTHRPTAGQTTDYCCGTDVGAAGGIGPRDSRQFSLPVKNGDAANPPIVRLTFVMFDDLSYEGSGSKRAEVLATRERNAEDIGYVLSIRAEAASKPRGELVPFLEAKRLERAKALGIGANQARLRYLDDVIRVAERGPDGLGSNSHYIQHLEKYRDQLLRHVKR